MKKWICQLAKVLKKNEKRNLKSTFFLVYLSTRHLVNLQSRQLAISSTCQLVNLSTCQLVNSPTCQLANLSTRQLANLSTCQLVNSSTRQLANSSTCQLANLSTRQLVNSSTIENLIEMYKNVEKAAIYLNNVNYGGKYLWNAEKLLTFALAFMTRQLSGV